MQTIRTVGIKELKDSLSSYLREIKAGVLVLITDRGRVVAQLNSPTIFFEENSLLAQWIDQKKIIPTKKSKTKCQKSSVSLVDKTSQLLLNLDRGNK